MKSLEEISNELLLLGYSSPVYQIEININGLTHKFEISNGKGEGFDVSRKEYLEIYKEALNILENKGYVTQGSSDHFYHLTSDGIKEAKRLNEEVNSK
ncbi:MAG: hypothetical protein HPY53_01255 [Brevinematales bacterium]|nr:hypothetical protein [Brevinematales bacterium]